MKRALAVAVFAVAGAMTLGACGSDKMSTGDDDQGSPDAAAAGMVTNVTADVSTNTTWSGTVRVQSAISVDSGVTLTVAPGTTIQIAESASITVKGTVNVGGTKAAPVIWEGLATDDWPGGMGVPSGGAFTMTYGTWTGGNIDVTGGSFTATDSQLSRVFGDLFTAAGGTIDVEYSWLGLETGMSDTTHCDMHFEGNGGPQITVTHTNVSTSAYGVMFYNGVGANFTFDNWFSNSIQVDLTTAVTGDFSNGWFDKSPPSGTGITANSLASARLTDAGPR